ncbi:MAG: hypothetical protein ACK4SY_08215 [Pyrobaculum sp.]
MLEGLWEKIHDGIVATLAGHLDKEVVWICRRYRSFCEEKFGIYVYNDHDYKHGKQMLFTVSCRDYMMMGYNCKGSDHYYVNGLKFIDTAIKTIAEDTSLAYNEVLEVVKRAAEGWPEWTTTTITYIAFLPYWRDEYNFHHNVFENNIDLIITANEFLIDLLEYAKEVFPDKAEIIDKYIDKKYELGDMWKKIYRLMRGTLEEYIRDKIGHICIAKPNECRKFGIYVYTMADNVDIEKYDYITSIYQKGIRYKLYIRPRLFIDEGTYGVIKYAERNGVRLDEEKTKNTLITLAREKPEHVAKVLINGMSYYFNCLTTYIKADVETQTLDEFIKMIQQTMTQDVVKTTQTNS